MVRQTHHERQTEVLPSAGRADEPDPSRSLGMTEARHFERRREICLTQRVRKKKSTLEGILILVFIIRVAFT